MTALPVATALSQLEAAIGDRLISQNGFAEYGDDGWEGQLAMMNPTEGYITALQMPPLSAIQRMPVEMPWKQSVPLLSPNRIAWSLLGAMMFTPILT